MSGFDEINKEMQSLGDEIETISRQLEEKRTAYETAKHQYELTYSGHIISGKARNPDWTQTDAVAHAVQESGGAKATMILAHGEYRKLRADLNAKHERLETVKEKGWNLRMELKRL